MIKFINLTKTDDNNNYSTIYLNIDRIIDIAPIKEGSIVRYNEGNKVCDIRVIQSALYIASAINNDKLTW